MKKLMMLALLGSIATGCVPLHPTDCLKKNALEPCSYNRSGKVTDTDIYGQQAAGIKNALDSALADRHAWKGKTCNMHLDFNYDGKLQNIIIKGGDKAYCDALEVAAKKADFPPFTDQKVYDVMSSARWNMQGY
ncbi:cell envelope integrity TolA C-terminal domain-containing protein [Kosakonia sp. MUSA4]|uniref:cell envelope integrity TolA C-terminal domain-containing protein n=1 Tax=Kosakonia sp. MUSA4 TaxID=2067958 RepID=UPI001598C0A9|nr:cell envelope integrity TolA C-terminal domain-containing protein [Kosakonia sp. MUSA4]QJT80705.1 tolA family protein [Kosakonia sp. MUSA4]